MTRFALTTARAAAGLALAMVLCGSIAGQRKTPPRPRVEPRPIVTRIHKERVKPIKLPPPRVQSRPVVTRIDNAGLAALLKPKVRPLLINFWATWCDPCRDEFPELVKLDEAYRGKIDFVTVSLDDLADIKTTVPKFLSEMRAKMPAYLLKTPDESSAISMVSKDYTGGLPVTVLYKPNGEIAFFRNGPVTAEMLSAEIDKVLGPPAASGPSSPKPD